MGNIQDLLAQILSARYGRDVRQSIHDAIRQCYDDGRAGAIDLEARTLLGDTDISGISETVTGAVVELNGAKQNTSDALKVTRTTETFTNVTISANGGGYTFNIPIPSDASNARPVFARTTTTQPLTVTSLYTSSGNFVVRLNNITASALTLNSITVEVTYLYN